MKKKYWLLLLLLGVLLAPPGWAQTARSVTGIVTTATDQSPLPGVTVLVKGIQTRHMELASRVGVVSSLRHQNHLFDDLGAAVAHARSHIVRGPAPMTAR